MHDCSLQSWQFAKVSTFCCMSWYVSSATSAIFISHYHDIINICNSLSCTHSLFRSKLIKSISTTCCCITHVDVSDRFSQCTNDLFEVGRNITSNKLQQQVAATTYDNCMEKTVSLSGLVQGFTPDFIQTDRSKTFTSCNIKTLTGLTFCRCHGACEVAWSLASMSSC